MASMWGTGPLTRSPWVPSARLVSPTPAALLSTHLPPCPMLKAFLPRRSSAVSNFRGVFQSRKNESHLLMQWSCVFPLKLFMLPVFISSLSNFGPCFSLPRGRKKKEWWTTSAPCSPSWIALSAHPFVMIISSIYKQNPSHRPAKLAPKTPICRWCFALIHNRFLKTVY